MQDFEDESSGVAATAHPTRPAELSAPVIDIEADDDDVQVISQPSARPPTRANPRRDDTGAPTTEEQLAERRAAYSIQEGYDQRSSARRGSQVYEPASARYVLILS